jgi:hypothetical protein
LERFAELRYGGAVGLDTLAAEFCLPKYRAKHVLYAPAASYDSTNDYLPFDEVFVCGRGLGPVAAIYRQRNEDMLANGCTHLMAFVHKPVYYRSGEWMTINIARREGIEVGLLVIP